MPMARIQRCAVRAACKATCPTIEAGVQSISPRVTKQRLAAPRKPCCSCFPQAVLPACAGIPPLPCLAAAAPATFVAWPPATAAGTQPATFLARPRPATQPVPRLAVLHARPAGCAGGGGACVRGQLNPHLHVPAGAGPWGRHRHDLGCGGAAPAPPASCRCAVPRHPALRWQHEHEQQPGVALGDDSLRACIGQVWVGKERGGEDAGRVSSAPAAASPACLPARSLWPLAIKLRPAPRPWCSHQVHWRALRRDGGGAGGAGSGAGQPHLLCAGARRRYRTQTDNVRLQNQPWHSAPVRHRCACRCPPRGGEGAAGSCVGVGAARKCGASPTVPAGPVPCV